MGKRGRPKKVPAPVTVQQTQTRGAQSASGSKRPLVPQSTPSPTVPTPVVQPVNESAANIPFTTPAVRRLQMRVWIS